VGAEKVGPVSRRAAVPTLQIAGLVAVRYGVPYSVMPLILQYLLFGISSGGRA